MCWYASCRHQRHNEFTRGRTRLNDVWIASRWPRSFIRMSLVEYAPSQIHSSHLLLRVPKLCFTINLKKLISSRRSRGNIYTARKSSESGRLSFRGDIDSGCSDCGLRYFRTRKYTRIEDGTLMVFKVIASHVTVKVALDTRRHCIRFQLIFIPSEDRPSLNENLRLISQWYWVRRNQEKSEILLIEVHEFSSNSIFPNDRKNIFVSPKYHWISFSFLRTIICPNFYFTELSYFIHFTFSNYYLP